MILLALALAACSRSSGPEPTSSGSAAANAVPAAAGPAAPALPPMPDAAHDDRPDKVKLVDFLGRIEAQQASLAAADAAVIRQARTALSAGDEPGARIALASYQTEIGRELAALPQSPRLVGCFAQAREAADNAAAGAAAMLADRRDKAAGAVGSGARPLALADFGPLATDIGQPAPGDAIKADVARARAATADCGETPRPRAAEPAVAAAGPPAAEPAQPAAGPVAPSGEPSAAPATQPSSPQPARKPGFLDRFRRMFQ